MAEEESSPGEDHVLFGRVRVHPPSIDFRDVEKGIKYVIEVKVKNVSHRSERVRFLAPAKGSGFEMKRSGTATVAPGMEATAEVEFVLAADQDYHSTLEVNVSGVVLGVPMHAFRPRAELELETTLKFGTVVHDNVTTREIKVINKGKRQGHFSFDVRMVNPQTSEDLAPAALRDASVFEFLPSKGIVAAGETEIVKVALDARALGPVRGLARLDVSHGVGPSVIDLSGNVLMQRVEMLDTKGVLMPKDLEFGKVFAGLYRAVTCTLVNNGPRLISFSLATLTDDDEPQELAEDEGVDSLISDQMFAVQPSDGTIQPFGTFVITFTFAPPQQLPSNAGFRSTRAEQTSRLPERFAVAKRLSVLETGQAIDVVLTGMSVTPQVTLSRSTVQFSEPCKLYDHMETTVAITNGNKELPVDFSLDKVANFSASPSAGRLAPGASRDIVVSFCPKQQGGLSKVITCSIYKGRVMTLPLHVSGVCQGTDGRRKLVGGPLALPEDFEREPNFAPAGVRPVDGGVTKAALRQPVGDAALTGRKTLWEETAEMDATLAAGLGRLAKRRTYAEQMGLQRELDRKAVQQTGFELSARELAAVSAHKERYNAFLRTSHAERSVRQQAQFVKPTNTDLADFEQGVDMGMASLTARGAHPLEGGWSADQPRLDLPKHRDPLWLAHPYDADGEPLDPSRMGKSRVLLFDDRKLIKRKHKPKPTTAEEIAHCNMRLTPKEIMLVQAGPKTVDFGTVSVFTSVHRSFNIANDLLTAILVTVDSSEEEELRNSSPESQVVPPNGIAGFDLVFTSSEVQSFRRSVSYSINDRYTFRFNVVAEVMPIDVDLSTDELAFKFAPEDLNPALTLPVTLHNRGTYKAEFECRGPAVSTKRPVAFDVNPERAAVEAGKTLDVEVTFTPTPGAANEHMLTFVVEGGPSRTLLCKAEAEESKVTAEPRRVDFGTVPIGIPKEMTMTLKNTGAEPAVYYWDAPPDGLFISPQVDSVPPNGTAEVVFEFAPSAPLRLDDDVVLLVRGGKPVKVHVTADAQVPQVGIVEDEFDFGVVTVGGKVARTFTVVNTGVLAAMVDVRLSNFPGFDLTYTPPENQANADEGLPDEEVTDSPIQLISYHEVQAQLESQARASSTMNALAAAAAAAAEEEEETAIARDESLVDDRDYRVAVPAAGTVELKLVYQPKEVGTAEFELPVALTGLIATSSLGRVVTARAVASRVVLDPSCLDLGSCTVREGVFPYTGEVQLTNVDPQQEPIRWELDPKVLPDDGSVEVSPTSGTLDPGMTTAIQVIFRAERPCAVNLSVPLYLDGDYSRTYLYLEVVARGVMPRILFDRSEVVLPAVPLGVTSAVTFFAVNDGFDNLEVLHKLPADTAKVPLSIYYPEGRMIGLAKQRLPIVVSFSSKKPMSFTAKIHLVDQEGRKYGITVAGSSDNSVLTVNAFLKANKTKYEIVAAPGKPLMLLPKGEVDLGANRRGSKRRASKSNGGDAAGGRPVDAVEAARLAAGDEAPPGGVPAVLPEFPRKEALGKAIAEAEKEAAVLQPWIKSFLLDYQSSRPFPLGQIAARGKALIDILEAVSGKNVAHAVPRDAASVIQRPPKSRLALARALHRQYDAVLTFLKQHGALLGGVKPEDLLSRDDFLRFRGAQRVADAKAAAAAASQRHPPPTGASAGPPPTADKPAAQGRDGRLVEAKLSVQERREMAERHPLISLRAWCAVYYQLIRVFFLARITPRAFRTTPGVAELLDKNDTFEESLAGPNIYTVSESILLHWTTLHWRKVAPEKATGSHARITSLRQLRDGHVLAALILSHAPFVAAAEEQVAAPPPTAQGDAAAAAAPPDTGESSAEAQRAAAAAARDRRPGSSILRLHKQPCTAEQALANVSLCVDVLAGQLAMERAPSPEVFIQGTERDLLLVLLGLYHTLPHYVPKTTIDFACALHEELTKTIELSNPAKKPIQYQVRVEGSASFHCPLGTMVRLEPRSSLSFPVVFSSRFAADSSARLLFLSRGDGINVAHATSLVFLLSARITSKKPHASLNFEGPLYAPVEREVVVTNPFEEACVFRIGLTETRPPLDQDASFNTDHAAPAGSRRPSHVPGEQVARAARGVVQHQKLPPEKELERALRKLPEAFHVVSADPRKPEMTLNLAPGASQTIRIQFLPMMLGEHRGEISFLDEGRGEFVYSLQGQGLLPEAVDTFTFRSDAGTSLVREFPLPFLNEALEKARNDALRRLGKVRDKDLERAREPLRKPPLFFKIDFSGHHFGGPPTIELVPGDKRRGAQQAAAAGSGASSKPQTAAHSTAETPAEPGQPGYVPPANLINLNFMPKQPGLYQSKMVLYSPLDVRVFNLQGTAPVPGTRATLEFTAPARRVVRQDVPILNPTKHPWELAATVTGQYFRGPASFRVEPGETENYPLEFCPEWICQSKGELVLVNETTADKFAYALSGTGEEPLSEGMVLIEVAARSTATHDFGIFNVSEDGKECDCEVESDLMYVSGEPRVKVPARVGSIPFGKQAWGAGGAVSRRGSRVDGGKAGGAGVASRRASSMRPAPAKYSLSITPQLGGSVHGSVTVRFPDGRYLWYTVEIRASPPPAERTIDVSCEVRKATQLEIEVANPLPADVTFDVELEGEGLIGASTLTVPAESQATYEVVFAPLTAGVSSGAVSFLNPSAGEFWYKLLLTGLPAPPVELSLLECELCKTAEHVVRVENPLGEPVALRAQVSNARNWLVGTKGGGPLTLPAYGSLEVVIQYSPSALGDEQKATVQLIHARMAEWVYHVRGLGTPPTRMPAQEVSAELGSITSGSVTFVNPFDSPIAVNVSLRPHSSRADAFALLLRRPEGVIVNPRSKLQISFTFQAEDMSEHSASVIVAVSDQHLQWDFPVVGYAESRPVVKPFVLSMRARQRLETMLELPLNGLDESLIGTAFTVELVDVPEEHAESVGASLRMELAGPLTEDRVLPVAVQWMPLKPFKAHVHLVVRQASGGRWKYDLTLQAAAPEVDDVIYMESTLNKTASVSFALANAFNAEAEFTANFTADSPTVFSVRPEAGVLPRAGTFGQQFVIDFRPFEYGKMAVGILVITTAEMQWTYEVRGQPPAFVLPEAKKRIDDQISPDIERRLEQDRQASMAKNFLRRNMQNLQ